MSKRFNVRMFLARLYISFCFGLSALFFWLFYERYLRLDFNELGRYYDAEAQTVYTDSGFVWSLPAAAFLLLGATALVRLPLKNRGKE